MLNRICLTYLIVSLEICLTSLVMRLNNDR